MKTIHRNIPEEKNPLLFSVRSQMRKKDKDFKECYEYEMVSLEEGIEKDLISFLRKMGVNASVKSDRYSLPYNKQIIHTGYGESYLNAAFETDYFFRKIAREILDKDLFKVRFYILAEIVDHFPMGRVNYYFNYYLP